MRILKYKLSDHPIQTLELPYDTQFLSVQLQAGVAVLWALVPSEIRSTQSRTILAHLTGENVGYEDVWAKAGNFLGTVQFNPHHVVHYFERIES